MPTETDLTPRARKVLARIDDGAEIAVPDLIKRVANLKEFQKLAKPRNEVHRVLDHLVAMGFIAEDYQPGPKGTPIRYVSRRQQP
jgi:hypothetical protein